MISLRSYERWCFACIKSKLYTMKGADSRRHSLPTGNNIMYNPWLLIYIKVLPLQKRKQNCVSDVSTGEGDFKLSAAEMFSFDPIPTRAKNAWPSSTCLLYDPWCCGTLLLHWRTLLLPEESYCTTPKLWYCCVRGSYWDPIAALGTLLLHWGPYTSALKTLLLY